MNLTPRHQSVSQAGLVIETVTGERISLSRWAGFHLEFVVESGPDFIAQIRIVNVECPVKNRSVRVFVSKHPAVGVLMELARERGTLQIRYSLSLQR